MKLILIKSQEILPDTSPYTWKKRHYVTSLGNPFSDEKTVAKIFESAQRKNYGAAADELLVTIYSVNIKPVLADYIVCHYIMR